MELFLLAKNDNCNSKIWAKFQSDNLRQLYLNYLKNKYQKEFVDIIKPRLNWGRSTIEKQLIKLKKSSESCVLPLRFIEETRSFLGDRSELNFTYLTYKNYNSQPIKIPSELTEDLAFILGGYVADGQLYKQTYIAISEGHKKPLAIINKKLKRIFGYEGKIYYSLTDHTFKLFIRNKIIVKYITCFFEFKPGKKSKTVKVPKLILSSDDSIKKTFLRGLFTFDGCVKTTGMVSLTSQSKNVINFVKNFFKKEKIEFKVTYNEYKSAWLLETSSGRKGLCKLLDYFEEGTLKYGRLEFFAVNRDYSLKALNRLFPKHYLSKISLIEVYEAIKKLKKCDIKQINYKLKNVAITTIYKYLYILHKAGIINKEKVLVKSNKNSYYRTYYSLSIS